MWRVHRSHEQPASTVSSDSKLENSELRYGLRVPVIENPAIKRGLEDVDELPIKQLTMRTLKDSQLG